MSLKLMKDFDKLRIEQIKDIIIKVVKDNNRLREKLKIYQDDIKQKKDPQTAQDFVDWVDEDERGNFKNDK